MKTLVDGESFLLTGTDAGADGFYHRDTRHLLPPSISVEDIALNCISERRDRTASLRRRLANVGTEVNEISTSVATKHATVVADRHQTVSEGRLRDRVRVVNHSDHDRRLGVTVGISADFADIFELRGSRDVAERDVTRTVSDDTVVFSYAYEDARGECRTVETAVGFDRSPDTVRTDEAAFRVELGAQESWQLTLEVRPGREGSTPHRPAPGKDRESIENRVQDRDPFVLEGSLETGDREYDRVFAQAQRDVRSLTTFTEYGLVPLAGAPWFVTVFGRDALLASRFLLPVAPALARGTLTYLADWQGTAHDAYRDESPGKILHEIRQGELAHTGAIPHRPYYGSIDATPLWITLLYDTWRWTGDDGLVTRLQGTLDSALECIDRTVGAVGDDPFLYYRTVGKEGVVHKEWRDSTNGVQYRNGREATPPLASAAVQGYRYAALTGAAELASTVRGDESLARTLETEARELAEAFDEAFWMADRQTYATALTPDGEQVDSVTSAVGHCLWSEIVPPARIDAVVESLFSPDMFSGWGLRTLAADDDAYSPVSYHAGGIWPHDNAIAALGLAAYGRHEAVARIVKAQLDALVRMDRKNIPELFCGFDDSSPPEEYPSACRPQIWSAAAPFGYLQALFSLTEPATNGTPEPRQQDVISERALDTILGHWE